MWSAPRDLNDGTGRKLSAIDRLYARFDGMYMEKWKRNFTSPAAVESWKEAWSDSLTRNGVTPRMAFDALQKCEREHPTWAPTVGEFLTLCKPPMDYEQAFHDAVRQMHKRHMNDPKDPDCWPHPAIYWAALDFGQYELRQASYSQAAAKWRRVLDKRLESECPDVPVFALQLAAPARNDQGEAITSAEAKASALAAMRALVARTPSREVAADKARAVLARHEAGEPVLAIQLNHAREVLARLATPDPDGEP